MSAADSEEHEEQHLHQAGWVYFLTYAVCLAFLAVLMLINPRVDSALPGLAILWFTIISIPVQLYLARREWTKFMAAAAVAIGGYLALPMVMSWTGILFSWIF